MRTAYGERAPSEVGSRRAFTTAWPWAPVPPITKTRLSTGSFTARLFPSRKYKTRRQRHATQPISKAAEHKTTRRLNAAKIALPLFQLSDLLVRLDHAAGCVVNAN